MYSRTMVELNDSNYTEKIPNNEDDKTPSEDGDIGTSALKRKSLFTISGVFVFKFLDLDH